MDWHKSESTARPDEVDTTSSKTTVFLRRNIKEVQRKNEISENETIYYEYEEAKLTKEEYEKYLQVSEAVNMRQIRADLDYIALCSGIEL